MNNRAKKHFAILSIFMAILDIIAQASSKIYDRQTLQQLIGATIRIRITDKRTTGDENGFYSLYLKLGIFCPYLVWGMKLKRMDVSCHKDLFQINRNKTHWINNNQWAL